MAPPPDSRQLRARHHQPTAPTHRAASPTSARCHFRKCTGTATRRRRNGAAGRAAGSQRGNLQRCMPSHRPDTRPTRPDPRRHTIWRGGVPRTRPRQSTICLNRAALRTGATRRYRRPDPRTSSRGRSRRHRANGLRERPRSRNDAPESPDGVVVLDVRSSGRDAPAAPPRRTGRWFATGPRSVPRSALLVAAVQSKSRSCPVKGTLLANPGLLRRRCEAATWFSQAPTGHSVRLSWAVPPLPTYRRARECSQPMEIHMTMINPATMTVTQAATMLGISRSSAYECVRLGTIPSIRLGRRIVIPRRSLDELLASARFNQPGTA